jgi:tRNA-Thr(GGU) m(6)t(6)A37 methyltransferase TsaA
MSQDELLLRPIGAVRSTLRDRSLAPMQGHEGAPDAWIELVDEVVPAARHLAVGDDVLLLTWLHQADRTVLEVHPRSDPAVPLTGVFSTRSPDRPNPIGLHEVRVLAVDGARVRVGPLEAIDGTPVLDLKPLFRRAVAGSGPRRKPARPARKANVKSKSRSKSGR